MRDCKYACYRCSCKYVHCECCYLRLVVVRVPSGPENGRRSVPHLRTFVLAIGREAALLWAMFNPVFFQCQSLVL